MGDRKPGPMDQVNSPIVIDGGTLCLQRSCAPSLTGIDAASAALPVKWTPKAIAEYRSSISGEGLKVAQTAEEFDCADWAFSMLIRFASQQGLPLKFHKVGSGDIGNLRQRLGEQDNIEAVRRSNYDPSFPESSASAYGEYFSIEARVRRDLGARDLILTGFDNVVPVTGIDALLPGDILALSAGEHRHIQLVLANNLTIQVWDENKKSNETTRVLDILQGDLPAAVIRRAAWDLTNGQYYRYDFARRLWQIETDTPGDVRKLWNVTIFGRRWNFERFNEAVH